MDKINFPNISQEIFVTRSCNLSCPYCFEKNKTLETFTIENLKKIIEESNTLGYSIFGGEPFLALDQLSYLYNTGLVDRYIITNGTLIDFDFVKKYNISLGISLDGPKDIQNKYRGHYDEIISVINRCKNENIKFNISHVISKPIYNRTYDVFRFFWDLFSGDLKSILRIKSSICVSDEINDKDIDTYIEENEKIIRFINSMNIDIKNFINKYYSRNRKCNIAFGTKTIAPDLNLYACYGVMGTFLESEYKLGSIESPSYYKSYNKLVYEEKNPSITCPIFNELNGGSIFHPNAKFTVLREEFNRFLTSIINYGI